MNIYGFNKTTLLDYPGKLAATIFLGGCNFRCPFCHNSSLVLLSDSLERIDEDSIFHTLNTRKGILEGVCITGGEPTLSPGLDHFMQKIKDLGLLIKLDTNGSNPEKLKELVHRGLVDYIAMDIKNTKEKYLTTAGLSSFHTQSIFESVDFLLAGTVAYEFRTTVVKELHTPSDLLEIGNWIKGATAYFLQAYEDSPNTISPGFTCYSKKELHELCHMLKPYVQNVNLRGVD
ncbi:MAG: anaerobic ribonucleoside-triphosphate reductase activating protein [Anaerocolumna sp.]